MDNLPQRRFWQIHLSTVVLSTIAASILVGANLHKVSCHREYDDDFIVVPGEDDDNTGIGFGWPQIWNSKTPSDNCNAPIRPYRDNQALCADVIYGLIALTILVVTCETRIAKRRRSEIKSKWTRLNPFHSVAACIVAQLFLISHFYIRSDARWGWPVWMGYSTDGFAGVWYLIASSINFVIAMIVIYLTAFVSKFFRE